MVVYFTGTGNSRYCARMLASKLGDELIDAGAIIKSGVKEELSGDRPWVFVGPTYAWQMARVFANFIREGSFSGSRDAYFVLTCGDEAGNAGESLEELCQEKGFVYRGVLEVPMPENYVAMFAVPDEETCARMIAAARPVLERGIACIEKGEPFPGKRVSGLDKLKSGPINKGFYGVFVNAKKFYTTDACVGCGKCAQSCVLNNISMESGKPAWGGNCTHCMACICGCPARAIEYGRASRGKRRHLCEEYQE